MIVFSNLAISLDGRIADNRQPAKLLGTPEDRRRMQVLRAKADVILTGSGTLRAHPNTYRLKGEFAKKHRQPANAILSASGKLDSEWKFWSDPGVVRFVFTSEKGRRAAEAAAQERAFVEVTGETQVDLVTVLKRLKKSGIERVLVEGGGEVMASFLEAKLLNEIYLTITPKLLGAAGTRAWLGARDCSSGASASF